MADKPGSATPKASGNQADNLYWDRVRIHVPDWQLKLHAGLFLDKLERLSGLVPPDSGGTTDDLK